MRIKKLVNFLIIVIKVQKFFKDLEILRKNKGEIVKRGNNIQLYLKYQEL